jgi:uncharacterized protein (TIRG00374 family)
VRHPGKAILGLVVTILLLWWALRGVPFAEVWGQIRQGDFLLLGAAAAVATLGLIIRAMRWKVLLTPVKSDSAFGARFASTSIGFMANNLLPARAGEFARAYALSRLEPVSASAAFGSLVVERFLDMIVLLVFLVLPVFTPGFPSVEVPSEGIGVVAVKGALVVVAAIVGVLLVMAFWPGAFVRVTERIARRLPRSVARPIVDASEAFLDSIALIRSPRLLMAGFAWTVAFWLWHGLSFLLGMRAFGIETGPVSAYFTSSVVAFGVSLPAAPGFVGTFHASADFALGSVYGVEAARSLAFAFGYHFAGWIPVTALGLYFAWRLGLTLGDVGASEERVEEVIEGEHPGLLDTTDHGQP